MSAESECHACGEPVYDIDVRCGNCDVLQSSTGAQRMIGSVVLEHYVVTDILGQGGMSVVYKGKHKITGQEVALKVLPPELAAHRDLKGRFLEEGKALAQLDHPNIVHLYNFGADGDCLILAMQYVRGITWERLIIDEERVDWRKSAQLTAQVSDALDYAHGRGIIHRDMKPSNVLIRELDGAGTVMDFGIAKVQSSSKLTATGQTMGTVRYMSPEQVRGKPVGVGTDIYSLAMTTYESLVGDTPFVGETHFEIMTKHLTEVPKPPSEVGVELPPAFERALMRAMSKRPEDRQSTAKEFKEQLEAVLASSPVTEISNGEHRISASGKQHYGTALDETAMVSGIYNVDRMAEQRDATIENASPKRSLGIALAGVAVLVAASTTLYLLRDQGDTSTPQQAKIIAIDAAPPTMEETLGSSLILPAEQFSTDRTFFKDGLRVLSTDEWPAEKIRNMVMQARSDYTSLAVEQHWSPEISLPLRLVIVSQSDLCNPRIYLGGIVPANCMEEEAWYRPKLRTLYMVPTKENEMQGRVSYWIAMAACLHADFQCVEVIQRKLGPN